MSEWDLNQASAPSALEVSIAPLGRRFAAYLINGFLTGLLFVPAMIAVVLRLLKYMDQSQIKELAVLSQYADMQYLFDIALIALPIYGLLQTWMMSRYGQSIGKRLMNIRVIKTNGTDAGFMGAVLLREILFNIIVGIAGSILGMFVALIFNNPSSGEIVSNLVQSALWITCFVMACDTKRDRRTLQDMLANTVVVALPRKR